MWDTTGNSSWTYDEYGRVTTQTRVVDGRSYVSANTYDALDRVREMTYPDNETLTYSYQPNTLLDGIQSSIGNLDLVSDIVYKDIGLPVSYTLGGGTTTASQSFEYWKIDDASRSPFAALKRIKLSKDANDLVNREMQYDAVGNVTRIVDGVNSETIDYTYDDLDRILTSSVPTGESFAYDTIGNMTSKAGTALDYGTTAPKHAVKSHGTTTYSYDANGSLTAKGTQTVKYDPEQRPIRIQDGISVHRATYDGDGVRRKRDDSNGTVHYLGSYERKLAGGSSSPETITKYYSASLGAMSRPMAFRRSGTLHWLSSDHLGGTIRVLDSSFTALDGMRYKPYGEDRDTGSSLNTDRKFTGQTEDEAAGLYWYASRAYDPEIGRFCSPDPIVPAPGNPQSLNRYSYVYNNPLKYTDPTGNSAEWLNEAWRKEFYDVHDKEPEDGDFIYRYVTMAAATGLKEQIFGPLSHDYDMRFVLPEGNQFDLGANIRKAAELGEDRSPLSALEFISLLKPHAEWDYKSTVGPEFENFGNFHFGIVVSAFLEAHTPVPSPRRPNTPALVPQEKRDEFALSAAGIAHIRWTGGGEGMPFIIEPYGDDPKDQAWIKLGMHFYHAMSISVVRRAAKL